MGGIPTRSVRRNVECRRPCMMCTSSPPPGGNVTCGRVRPTRSPTVPDHAGFCPHAAAKRTHHWSREKP
ncbi:hypothetical protein BHE74_00047534 [Ensete ventricosum]|nr:hypothetical protein BHE74_00047534 [Ensete ventricosum]